MVNGLHLRRLALGLALAFSLSLAGGLALRVGAEPAPPTPGSAADAVEVAPDKLVVAVAPGFNERDLRSLLARHGAQLEKWLPRLGLALVSISAGQQTAVTEGLDAEPAVDFVAPHRKLARVADVPLDDYWSQQWGPAQAQAPAAWDLAWSDPGVVIAVLDTGVLQEHRDLQDRTWYNPGESAIDPLTGKRTCDTPIAHNGIDDDGNEFVDDCRGWDFVASDNNPTDEYGHGTAVAGIAAATTNNPSTYAPSGYEGIAGMGRQASLMAIRVLDSSGSGWSVDIAAGIDYAVASGAQVINLSLTYPPTTPDDSGDVQILRRAVTEAQTAGVLIVAAAGNENYPGVDYPAKFPGVLAVGASTRQDTRATFSNYGSRLDLLAPGEGIYATLMGPNLRTYGYFHSTGSGTSFAAPHVSGMAALVRGMRPDLGQDAIYELIRHTADDVGASGWDTETGWGRLNAYRAVSEAIAGLQLSLTADPPSVAVGGATLVHLQITAPSGAAAGLGARVTLTGTLGVISPTLVTADDTGRAAISFTAGSLTGTGAITATLGGLSAGIPLTVTSGTPAGLELFAAPSAIASGGDQAVITATARDEGGSFVPDGVEVAFTTTLGSVAPITATTRSGQAVTYLTSGTLGGIAVVEASVAGLTATVPVVILGAGEPTSITLAADPPNLHVGGVPTLVTATVIDGLGERVADGTPVRFTSDRGTLSEEDAVTAGGQASVTLSAGTTPGDAHITAQAGAARGELAVAILPGQPYTLSVTADPATLTAGYNQVAHLSAQAMDQYGNAVEDGTVLSFAASLGRMVSPTATTSGGRGTVDFLAELVAGTSSITVTAPGGAQGFVEVSIRPSAPAQLSLTADSDHIAVGGETVRVRATVQDTYGNRVADGTVVTFTTDLGELRTAQSASDVEQQAGQLLSQTTDGDAEVTLVSGQATGTAHVQAAVAPNGQASVPVSILPGPASTVILGVDPLWVPPGGRVELAASVKDRFGNAVSDGTTISFAASRGQLTQKLVPTQEGVALTWLIAPAQIGPIQVTADVPLSEVPTAFASVTVVHATHLPMVQK